MRPDPPPALPPAHSEPSEVIRPPGPEARPQISEPTEPEQPAEVETEPRRDEPKQQAKPKPQVNRTPRQAPPRRPVAPSPASNVYALPDRHAPAKTADESSKPPALGNRLYSQLHNQKQGWSYVLDLRKGGSRGSTRREGARRYRGYIRPDEWFNIRKETADEQSRIERVKATIRGKILAAALSRRARPAVVGR